MGIYCIDVSELQGNIDWKQLKEAGIELAMIRAGYGAGVIDLQFRKNAQGCNDTGISCGVYWFSYAYTPEMAEKEAEFCAETIEEYEISYPVCIDFEEASIRYARSRGREISKETAAEIIEKFCSRTEQLGYSAGYYSKRTGVVNPKKLCDVFKTEAPLKF